MTQQLDPTLRATIVVFDRETGIIRQVVHCSRADAEDQHCHWPGHGALDVTVSNPDASPLLHRVCLETFCLLPIH